MHHGVARNVNEGDRTNAAIINPEEEKDDALPLSREFQFEENGGQKRSDDWRIASHAHGPVFGVAEPRGRDGKERGVSRTKGRREAIYGVAVTQREEQRTRAHRVPELSPTKRVRWEVEIRIGFRDQWDSSFKSRHSQERHGSQRIRIRQ
ncbi:hypothetical protein K438DRAFT_1764797 [Mycena galopus ATCC 62051]|nr:hypothetical protein K438DRAFT_1764797 [Mycena galopus ATCC 62051]